MPRNQKDPQGREIEDEEREHGDAPRVDEQEIEDDDRVLSSHHSKADKDEYEVDESDIAEEIDLDDLSAMEGPDA